jgi:hypothetical protein
MPFDSKYAKKSDKKPKRGPAKIRRLHQRKDGNALWKSIK